jgi:magnesium chelatase accessory protein
MNPQQTGVLSAGWRVPLASAAMPLPPGLPREWPNRDAGRQVDAAGARWHVQRMGSGPRLLLIHGTAASTHSFRDLMPLLSERFDVLAPDLPGHGFSGRLPDRSMSLGSLASALGTLLETLDWSPQFVVGHSAGAAIALRMTLDGSIRPDKVVGLNAALLPFGGGMRRVFAPMARLFATTALMPRMVARRARDLDAVRRVLEGTGSRIDSAGAEMYQRLLCRETHVAAVFSMMASWDLHSLLRDLDRLEPELHLVSGALDKAVSPAEAERVVRLVPSASVTRLEGVGHLAHEEQPEQVGRVIARLCLETEPT